MTTYGLLDLFSLVSKMLAPFVDPMRAEFATRPVVRPTAHSIGIPVDSTPVQSTENPPAARMVEMTTKPTVMEIVSVETASPVEPCMVEMTTHRGVVSITSPLPEPLRINRESLSERVASDAGMPASFPDPQNPVSPLYVRKPAGKSWRYHAAHPDASGEKFRKLVTAAGRAKYEPCR